MINVLYVYIILFRSFFCSQKWEPFFAIPLGLFRILFYLLCVRVIWFFVLSFRNDARKNVLNSFFWPLELHISSVINCHYSILLPLKAPSICSFSLFSVAVVICRFCSKFYSNKSGSPQLRE